jgi:hypothetical protein
MPKAYPRGVTWRSRRESTGVQHRRSQAIRHIVADARIA